MPSLTHGCATAFTSHRSSKSEISIETGAKKERKKNKNCCCYKRIDISGSLGAQQSVTQKPKSGIPNVLATCLAVSSSLAVELMCKSPQAVPRHTSPPVSPSLQHQKAAGSATGCLEARGVGVAESDAGKIILVNRERTLLL